MLDDSVGLVDDCRAQTVNPPATLSADKRLKISKKIGKGSFADVYVATLDTETVALKVLRLPAGNKDYRVSLFLQEARTLNEHRHKNIVLFHGLVQLPPAVTSRLQAVNEPTWAIVQEYLQGSLGHLVRRQCASIDNQLYTDREALKWCLDIASATSSLHASFPAVIHRDIKLDNILISYEEGEPLAKLIDFGLAVVLEPEQRPPCYQRSSSCENHSFYSKSVPKVSTWDSLTSFRDYSPTGASWRSSCTCSSSGPQTYALDSRQTLSRQSEFPWSLEGVKYASSPSFDNSKLDTRGLVEKHVKTLQHSCSHRKCPAMFNLTGRTGSYMYMAPEVYERRLYNEKADVFSFAVVMFELFSRTVLALNHGVGTDSKQSEAYAERVAKGYRPKSTTTIFPPVMELIEACWAHDPNLRPSMHEVCQRLADTLQKSSNMVFACDNDLEVSAPRCACTIC